MFQCLDVKISESEIRTVNMIASCTGPSDYSLKCTEAANKSLVDLTPVKAADIVFKNVYCAFCSMQMLNFNKQDIEPWKPGISCQNTTDAEEILKEKGPNAFISYVQTSDNCELWFSDTEMKYHLCEKDIVQTCDKIYSGHENFSMWEQGCQSYSAAGAVSYNKTRITQFKNPHCALCNGYDISGTGSYSCAGMNAGSGLTDHIEENDFKAPLANFAVLLDFTDSSNFDIQVLLL